MSWKGPAELSLGKVGFLNRLLDNNRLGGTHISLHCDESQDGIVPDWTFSTSAVGDVLNIAADFTAYKASAPLLEFAYWQYWPI